MTEISPESTQPSSGTINVLPILSEAKAPVSVTLTVDNSIKKVAAWMVLVMIASALLAGIGIASILLMITTRAICAP